VLRIHEVSLPTGQLASVYLRGGTGMFEILAGERVLSLPTRALRAVMAKYGAPFDPDARITAIAELECDSARVRHVRHLAGYDVIARDYLVFEEPGEPVWCALAATVVPALLHLARAAAQP